MLLAICLIGMASAPAQAAKKAAKESSSAKDTAKKDLPAACRKSSDKEDDDDDDDDDDDSGVKFDLAGACATLTGGISYTYQKSKQTAGGLPFIVTRGGQVSKGTNSHSVTANVGLEPPAIPSSASSPLRYRPNGPSRPVTKPVPAPPA